MAAPRAGRGLRPALLLLLLLPVAVAEDSDATCKVGDPGCGTEPAEAEEEQGFHDKCPPLTEEQSATLNECTEGKKQWKWGLDRLQASDKEGATKFVIKAYQLCLKKMGIERDEQKCVRAWVEDTIEYKWLKQGLGVSPECKAEAHKKYSSGSSEVEECAQEYNKKLEGFDEPEEQAMIFSDILQNCAGVSPLCARQNGYMMAERAQQQALKEIGIDTKGGTVRR